MWMCQDSLTVKQQYTFRNSHKEKKMFQDRYVAVKEKNI